ncbi:uncharacterized protein LOC108682998 [Hyalella azteca]|uniref:Uncharacterized protein LOC108682998 n=1 Tax=Hyalella azteca TaxID=294128 RepID=A0A8B7PP34_HYAAZ|nr:uncharacterized protein LOC108682998 [Hyalella azteca]
MSKFVSLLPLWQALIYIGLMASNIIEARSIWQLSTLEIPQNFYNALFPDAEDDSQPRFAPELPQNYIETIDDGSDGIKVTSEGQPLAKPTQPEAEKSRLCTLNSESTSVQQHELVNRFRKMAPLRPLLRRNNFVLYVDKAPHLLGEIGIVYNPVRYHIIKSYSSGRGRPLLVPQIPEGRLFKLRQRFTLLGTEGGHIVDISDDHSSKQNEENFIMNGSYVAVVDPNFKLSFKDANAYIPDVDPTIYLKFTDLFSRVRKTNDYAVFPDFVPWPLVDFDRLVAEHVRKSGYKIESEVANDSFVSASLKREEKRLKELKDKRMTELTENGTEVLTSQCNHFPSEEDCAPNYRTDHHVNKCYCIQSLDYELVCCDYRNTAVYIDSWFVRDNTLFFTNANPLSISFYSKSVERIFIHSSVIAFMETTFPYPQWRAELYISNSTMTSLNGSDSVALTNTEVEDIIMLFPLKELVLIRTSVGVMADTFFRSMSEKKQSSFRAESSKIQLIYNVSFDHEAVLYGCYIQGIANSVVSALFVEGSSIDSIYPEGLKVVKTLSLINTRVGHLHRNAIIADRDQIVSLKNTVIEQCDEPCFLTSPGTIFIIENVMVNNKNMTDLKGHLHSPIVTTSLNRREFHAGEIREYCIQEDWRFDCDLVSHQEPLEFHLTRNVADSIVIRNHAELYIHEGACYHTVYLWNDVGSMYHSDYPHPNDRFNVMPCASRFRLQLHSTNLTTLYSVRITEVLADEGPSRIDHLDLSKVEYLKTKDLSIKVLEHLVIHPSISKEYISEIACIVIGGHIGVIQNLILHTPASFSNVNIDEIQSLIMNNFSPSHKTFVFYSCTFGLIHPAGLRLLAGHLYLHKFRFLQPLEGMIYLRAGAYLKISQPLNVQDLDCLEVGPIISAAHRNQVLYQGGIAPEWLWDCVAVREGPTLMEGASVTAAGVVIIEPLKNCSMPSSMTLNCDLSFTTTNVQIGGNHTLDAYKHAIVKNARNLIISDHCLMQLTLQNVTASSIQKTNYSCLYRLDLLYSTLDFIDINVLEFISSKSTISDVAPRLPLTFLECSITQVTNILATVRIGNLSRSVITTIKELVVVDDFVIEGCRVDEIMFIRVLPGATLNISSSLISEIGIEGIEVSGRLILNHVNVQRASARSIVVRETGSVEIGVFNVFSCHPLASPTFDYEDSYHSNEEKSYVMQIRNHTFTQENLITHTECVLIQGDEKVTDNIHFLKPIAEKTTVPVYKLTTPTIYDASWSDDDLPVEALDTLYEKTSGKEKVEEAVSNRVYIYSSIVLFIIIIVAVAIFYWWFKKRMRLNERRSRDGSHRRNDIDEEPGEEVPLAQLYDDRVNMEQAEYRDSVEERSGLENPEHSEEPQGYSPEARPVNYIYFDRGLNLRKSTTGREHLPRRTVGLEQGGAAGATQRTDSTSPDPHSGQSPSAPSTSGTKTLDFSNLLAHNLPFNKNYDKEEIIEAIKAGRAERQAVLSQGNVRSSASGICEPTAGGQRLEASKPPAPPRSKRLASGTSADADTAASGKSIAAAGSGKGRADAAAGGKGIADDAAAAGGKGIADDAAAGDKGFADAAAGGKGITDADAGGKAIADVAAIGKGIADAGGKAIADAAASGKGIADAAAVSGKGIADAAANGKAIADAGIGIVDTDAGGSGRADTDAGWKDGADIASGGEGSASGFDTSAYSSF